VSDRRLLHLHPSDNVCAAAADLARGAELTFEGAPLTVLTDVPLGHKIAVRPIARGAKVTKYGASIGSATADIAPGEHVHLHNLASDYLPPGGKS